MSDKNQAAQNTPDGLPAGLPKADRNPEKQDAFENSPDFISNDILTTPAPVEGDLDAVEDDAGAGLAGFGDDGMDVGSAI